MKTFKKILFCILIFFWAQSVPSLENNQKMFENELEQCLHLNWGVDKQTNAFIRNKFEPLLKETTHHSIVKNFIALSKKQKITFPADKEIKALQS